LWKVPHDAKVLVSRLAPNHWRVAPGAGNKATLLFDSLFVSLTGEGDERLAASVATVRIAGDFSATVGPLLEVGHEIRVEGSKTSGARVRVLVDAGGHIDTLTVPEPDSTGGIRSNMTFSHSLALPSSGFTVSYLVVAERDSEQDDAIIAIDSDDITVRLPSDTVPQEAR
jgi:hypothetical protein